MVRPGVLAPCRRRSRGQCLAAPSPREGRHHSGGTAPDSHRVPVPRDVCGQGKGRGCRASRCVVDRPSRHEVVRDDQPRSVGVDAAVPDVVGLDGQHGRVVAREQAAGVGHQDVVVAVAVAHQREHERFGGAVGGRAPYSGGRGRPAPGGGAPAPPPRPARSGRPRCRIGARWRDQVGRGVGGQGDIDTTTGRRPDAPATSAGDPAQPRDRRCERAEADPDQDHRSAAASASRVSSREREGSPSWRNATGGVVRGGEGQQPPAAWTSRTDMPTSTTGAVSDIRGTPP